MAKEVDNIRALLTEGEFVFTPTAVRNAGGPRAMYALMNALDSNSERPEEKGYQRGGTVLSSLLSRTQKKDKGPIYPKPEYTIPAGKNIFGQPTEEMGMDELMEMVMPMGAAQMGKGGIRAIMSSNKDDITKLISKLSQTGKGGKQIAKDVDWQTELQKYLKEATSRRFTNPVVKKQRGGSVGDYSLTGLLMPTMDKRLGKPLMKFEHGGQVRQPGEPGYYHYMQELGQAGTTQAPPPGTTTPIPPSTTTPPSTPPAQGGMGTEGFRDWQQSWLVQPSTSTSTGIQSIFQEMGFETPGEEYLSTVQAYDPTQQNRLREKIGRGMSGVEKSSFAGSGAERRDIGQKRDLLTEQYQMGAGDYRKQYREDVMAGVLDDLTQGTYDFEDLA